MKNCEISLFLASQYSFLKLKKQKSEQENMYTEGKNFSQQVRFAIKFGNYEFNQKFLLILLKVLNF